MQKNHATIAGIICFIAMIAGVMYGVKSGIAAIAIISMCAAGLLIWYLKRSVSPVIEDEWTNLVGQKAASLTMNATAILFAVIGIILITVSSPENNYDQAGLTIAAFLVTLAILYIATSIWYSHTLRGNGP
ncbi:DUF2178 domain-containing protein [Methanoregula sp.]|uniref:DUF2178 domain-containing protein n=1 Tax=Methanoregula sp. TaxID=2052170 RepID=UPI0035692A88